MPFVARAVSDRMLFLMPHKTNTTVEHDDLTSYAFLYGTIPTAPTVFIYATQYDIALPKVSNSVYIYVYYIIGTHSNNVLIWFTKRILGTVFLCPYNVCPK